MGVCVSQAAEIRRGLSTCYDCRGELSVSWMIPSVPIGHKGDSHFVAGASYCPLCIRRKAKAIVNKEMDPPFQVTVAPQGLRDCLDFLVNWMQTWSFYPVQLDGLRDILTLARFKEDNPVAMRVGIHGRVNGAKLMPVKRMLTAHFGITERLLTDAKIAHVKLSSKTKDQLADSSERASGEAVPVAFGVAMARELFARPTHTHAQTYRYEYCLEIMKGVARAEKLRGLATSRWPSSQLKKLCKRMDDIVCNFCDNYARHGYRGDGSTKTYVFDPANLIHAWQNEGNGLKAFNRLLSQDPDEEDDDLLEETPFEARVSDTKKPASSPSKSKKPSSKAASSSKKGKGPSPPRPRDTPPASSSKKKRSPSPKPRAPAASSPPMPSPSSYPTVSAKVIRKDKKKRKDKKRKSSPPANPAPLKHSKSPPVTSPPPQSPSDDACVPTSLPLIVMPTMAPPTTGKFGEDPPHPRTVSHPAKKPLHLPPPPSSSPPPFSPPSSPPSTHDATDSFDAEDIVMPDAVPLDNEPSDDDDAVFF